VIAEPVANGVAREHRRLDELLGRFFAAAHAGDGEASREAARDFDEALRRHMAEEEDRILPRASGHRLVAGEEETEPERLGRELRLEHVQIRELSAMLRRELEGRGDLKGAQRLAANLARRWDAHTAREEEALPRLAV
jgi:Hemerythrin HHE cation binding domain